MKKSPLCSRACIWKYIPPFVLLMGLEIKLHLCDFLVCVPTFPVVLKQHLQSPPPPPSGSAGGSPRIRYWPASGTPNAGERQKRGKILGCFLIDQSKKQMCSSYLPVTFYFILYKGSNKYLATCQKQFFCNFTKKCMSLVWFSPRVVKGILVFMKKEEKGRRRKRGKCSSGEVMLSFEPVYLLH